MPLPKPRLIICGAGPGGLSLASLARQSNSFEIIVIERSLNITKDSLGGGIGLWLNSLSTLRLIPGLVETLEAKGFYMPSPAYRNSQGTILFSPTPGFGDRFPILGLERDHLLKSLYESCQTPGFAPVRFVRAAVERYELVNPHEVRVHLSDQTSLMGSCVVACDGLHSTIRAQMLRELGHPPVVPRHCGYVYIRANAQVSGDEWHSTAFEAWGEGGLRLGYVPLQPPTVFWFIAVPSRSSGELAPVVGVGAVSEQLKQTLVGLTAHMMTAPIDVPRLIEMTPAGAMIKTDIFKVPNTAAFPWHAHQGRVILLGDAAHATAPNLAQGAGISIEDAADLNTLLHRALPVWPCAHGLAGAAEDYSRARKIRAVTVQTIADLVALVGSLQWLRPARDAALRLSALLGPQQRIFDRLGALSLGQLPLQPWPWQPPTPCLLRACLGHEAFAKLPAHVREFKARPAFAAGEGTVSVARGQNWLTAALASLAGLPRSMTQARFLASVRVEPRRQVWTRVFGFGSPLQQEYSTTHSLIPRSKGRPLLAEGVGGPLDGWVKFGYSVKADDAGGVLHFKSVALFVAGFELPFASLLSSEWTETPVEGGWVFKGQVSMPLVGRLMAYEGRFACGPRPRNERAVVLGGSGLVGSKVCERLQADGFDVVVASRRPKRGSRWPEVGLDEDWGAADVVVNLAGENPGGWAWTKAFKRRILASRLDAIERVGAQVHAPRVWIQASAVGVFGHRPGEALEDDASPGSSTTDFRVDCCLRLEQRARELASDKTRLVLLRLGHVLDATGGLLPHLRRAAWFQASRLGSGAQYVPWVHAHDAARAVSLLCRDEALAGPVVVAAPGSCTNAELMRALGSGGLLPVPSWALKLVLGDMASVLLDSQRAVPRKLDMRGFEFDFGRITEAVAAL